MSKNKILIWIIVAIILIAIFSVSGWLIYSKYYKNKLTPMKIEVSENQQNIEIKAGQEFTISLTSNASTGYSWLVDETYDKNIVNYIGNDYKASNSKMVGAPGTQFLTFKGANTGTTTLNLSYARSWEEKSQTINTKVFNITVK